ncbi:MAG TPA: hypothetical protein VKB88_29925 [Bryobacteraceae bacterium]|nr:hypothetical protein [Bryobacteraceae bacterium]
MTSQRTTTIVTLTAMVGLLVFAMSRRNSRGGEPTAETGPEGAVYAMLEAARTGDVSAYLAQYSGQMASTLKAVIAEKSESGFRDYLRSTNAEVKGIAVSGLHQVSDSEAELQLEYIFQDRNEVQTVKLDRLSGRWKIVRVDSAERVKTLVPYGTPVP